jgi:X-X-X-Leu-X-X-Gly heptad repeat protein
MVGLKTFLFWTQLDAGMSQLDAGITRLIWTQLDAGMSQLDSGMSRLDAGITRLIWSQLDAVGRRWTQLQFCISI